MQDPLEEIHWVYQCAACLSIELGIMHEEAIEMIVKNKADWGAHARLRIQREQGKCPGCLYDGRRGRCFLF